MRLPGPISIYFIFMQLLAKIMLNNRFAHPLWGILHLPLLTYVLLCIVINVSINEA